MAVLDSLWTSKRLRAHAIRCRMTHIEVVKETFRWPKMELLALVADEPEFCPKGLFSASSIVLSRSLSGCLRGCLCGAEE